MRLLDIYKETADGIFLLAEGLIQTGSTLLGCEPQSKFYTMGDGTTCCYATPTAKQTMTLELECTATGAAAIRAAMHLGSFLVAGMRFGTIAGAETVGYRVFPNGSAQIGQLYAGVDLFSAKIPLLLDASGMELRWERVPVLQGSVTLGETADSASHYRKTLRPEPVWERLAPVFVRTAALSFAVAVSRGDGGTLEGLTCTAPGAEQLAFDGSILTGTLPLTMRDNLLAITCRLTGCRPLRLRIPVYRQAGGGA